MKITTKNLVLMALFVALNLLFARYLVIWITDSQRIEFGDTILVLAGLFLGPAGGALVGAAGDILGTVISGRGWYPPLTAGPILVGLFAGLLKPFVMKDLKYWRFLAILVIIEIPVAVLLKSFLLSQLYGAPFIAMLLSRVGIAAVVMVLNSIFVFILYTRLYKQVDRIGH